MRFLSCLAVLLAFGCARNAVLEVDVDLPPGPAGRYAVVQFENQDAEFSSSWGRTDAWPGAALTAERQTVVYSVVTESFDAHVRIKVNFCTTADCSALDDAPDRVPAVWYELDHPFYRGRHTRWHVSIPTAPIDPPDEPITVERCAIAGCISAPDSTQSFCRFDGTHFCE
jgi:hypothetical protein